MAARMAMPMNQSPCVERREEHRDQDDRRQVIDRLGERHQERSDRTGQRLGEQRQQVLDSSPLR